MSTCVAVTGAMVLLVAIYVGHFADMDDFGYHGVPLTSCTHDASVPGSEHPSSFFEGWYTKLVSADGSQSLAFVAGAHVRDDHDGGCAAESFLLIVTDNGVATPQRYYTSLPPTLDVTNGVVSLNETSVRVSRNSVFFDVRQSQDMPRVTGHVAAAKAGHFWPVTPLNPGAMGWFGWIPGMQCYHGIFSMSTYIDGSITIDGTEFNFDGGRLYQEKDWGSSFPHSWVWMQGNNFDEGETSVFASIANVPFGPTHFPGFIVGFLHDGQLHKFATYTGAQLTSIRAWSAWAEDADEECEARAVANERGLDGFIDFHVVSFTHSIHITASIPSAESWPARLHAPINGSMTPFVYEALNGKIDVVMKDASGGVVFNGSTLHSGVEIMGLAADLAFRMANQDAVSTWDVAAALTSQASWCQLLGFAACCVLLLAALVHKCKAQRHYNDGKSVGDEYDAWTQDQVLEHFWGEHIHHGYYPDGEIGNVDFKLSKVDMNDRLLAWAGVQRGVCPTAAAPAAVCDASAVPSAAPSSSSSGIRVLDVGCGIGGSSRYLARFFGPTASVTGITLSPAQRARATEITAQAGLASQVTFEIRDALATKFPDNTFDLVWTMESGEHMPDKSAFMKEIARVLKPGGRVVMATWCTRDVTPATPFSSLERTRLERVYKEWALPFFISIQEYQRITPPFGFCDIKIGDWTRYALPTWPHSVLEGAKGIVWLLLRGPAVFFRTLRDVYAIWHMHYGYVEGTIKYGIFTARKGYPGEVVVHAAQEQSEASPVDVTSVGSSHVSSGPGVEEEESDSDSDSDSDGDSGSAIRRHATSPATALVATAM